MQVAATRRTTLGTAATVIQQRRVNINGNNNITVQNNRLNHASNHVNSNSTLTMYLDPPTEEITLADMEQLGYNRLQFLKHIENTKVLNRTNKSDNGLLYDSKEFTDLLQKYSLHQPRSDIISHFIMRLAFSKTEELRQWLATNETLLFRQKLESEDESVISGILEESGLEYTVIHVNQLTDDDDDLRARLQQNASSWSQHTVYYRMRYEDAWELLRGRQVVLVGGWAFVTRQQLSRVMSTKFRVHLKQQLAATHRAMNNLRQDQRVQPLVNALSKQYVGSSYKSTRITGSITRDQIPALVDRGSMPLCMSSLFKSLQTESHLKHGGRMQFGLFLKGIGLSMDESLAFWRLMFSRRVQGDKFDRQYAYNIRHNYGKEGKRTDYSPWSCMKIINEQPGAGDHHGCPFRHFDEQNLRTRMRDRRVESKVMDEIVNLVREKHFQVACKRFFAATHNNYDSEHVGNHPNAYFDASMKYYQALEQQQNGVKSESGVKTELTGPTQPSQPSAVKPEAEEKTQDPVTMDLS